MAKKSVKSNYIYNVSYQILTLLTPLITTPYVSRVLGADGVGAVSYAESIVSYFSLFAAMGISSYGQRETAYKQEDRQKRSEVFWETKMLSVITTLAMLLVYGVFVWGQDNSSLYVILAFNLLSVVADITWFFQGMEEFGIIVLRNIIFKCINIAYIFLAVRSHDDVLAYAFGMAFLTFLSNASLWWKLGKLVDKPVLGRIHPFRHLPEIISLFIPSIAISVYTVLDKTMIGVITRQSSENGYYEQALKISKMVLALVTSMGTVLAPRVAYYFARKEIKRVQDYMYRAYRFVWFLGVPLCLGLTGVASNMVPWFYGPGYEKIEYLLPVLSLLILAIGVNNVTGIQYLIPTKRQNLFTITVIVGAAVNLVLNLCLIPILASVGAAIASVAAETSIAVVQLILVRRELSALTILKSCKNYIVAGIIMEAVLWGEKFFMNASFICTAGMVVSGAAAYFLTLFLCRDSFFIDNAKSAYGKFQRMLDGFFIRTKG